MANEQQPAPASPLPTGEMDKFMVREVREFIQKYGPTILIGAGLAVAASLGFGAWQNHKAGQVERAARLLSGQPIPEEKLGPGLTAQRLQSVVERYPNTPSAPLALLALAAQNFGAAQYDLARANYTKFEEHYALHPFAPAAELGRLQCAEAGMMTDAALAGYEKFILAHPGHYLVPMAIFGKARCLETRGAFDNARITYEDFIAQNPNSPWEGEARTALQYLDMKKRSIAKGLPAVNQALLVPAGVVPPAPTSAVAPRPAPAK